jgi:hypothetical protein
MVRPIDPSNPTGGDGKEKYTPNEKRGPSKFDEALERAKSDRDKSGSGSSSGVPKSNRDLLRNMKAGGKVSSASKRADGCAIRGKTKA